MLALCCALGSLLLSTVTATGGLLNVEPGLKCACELANVLSFTATHSRNSTGQWNTEVSVTRGACAQDSEGVTSLPLTAAKPVRPLAADYELFPGVGHYKFHSQSQTWEVARKTCLQEGAHLAIVNSEAEAAVLSEIFKRHPTVPNSKWNDFAFVGFHDMYEEGSHLSIFGEPLNTLGFTRIWSKAEGDFNNMGQSDVDPGQDCGSIHRNGGLNDLNCDYRHGFFCEKELGEYPLPGSVDYTAGAFQGLDTEIKPPNGTVRRTRPGPGYEFFDGVGFYKLHTTSTTWENARHICRSEGGHLAIVNSEQEAQVLVELFKRNPTLKQVFEAHLALVGFHDMYVEGQYRTIYDEPLATQGYVRWRGSNPDNAGSNNLFPGQDCGAIARDGLLEDVTCERNYAFFCEQELYV